MYLKKKESIGNSVWNENERQTKRRSKKKKLHNKTRL